MIDNNTATNQTEAREPVAKQAWVKPTIERLSLKSALTGSGSFNDHTTHAASIAS